MSKTTVDVEKMDPASAAPENGDYEIHRDRTGSLSVNDAVFGQITEEGPNYRNVRTPTMDSPPFE